MGLPGMSKPTFPRAAKPWAVWEQATRAGVGNLIKNDLIGKSKLPGTW